MSQDNKKEVHLQPDLPEQGIGFAHRRQVIRGLASIPVALTLSNGAAASNASSHQCLMKLTTAPPCADSPIPGWLSDQVQPKDINGDPIPGKDPKYCVAYAVEDSTKTPPYAITGYKYESTFIGQNGQEVIGGMSGNPLSASCATSFAMGGGPGGPGGIGLGGQG